MSRVRISVSTIPEDGLSHRRVGRAFIGISLNNKTMGSSLLIQHVFEWTRKNVGEFDLLIGDYLNRHNYQAFNGSTEAAAIEQAMLDGDHATKRLSTLLAPHTLDNVAIISAGSLCKAPTFGRRLERLRRQYSVSDPFRVLIDEGVEAFLARKYPGVAANETVRAHCVSYQLEELAMFEMLVENGHSVFVYAGAQLPVMKKLVSGSLVGVSRELETLTLIELRLFEDRAA